MKLNLITVCTDAYPMEYANKLHRRFKQLTKLDYNAYCITDRPEQLNSDITPMKPEPIGDGWWQKMMLYSKDLMPEGYNLYMDIDNVLIKNFDAEIKWTMTMLEEQKHIKVACVSDAIDWMGNHYSSSMMIVPRGRMDPIYQEFLKEQKTETLNRTGGDQVWTGNHLRSNVQNYGSFPVLYIDDRFPNLKRNLKFHLGKKILGQWKFPLAIPSNVKIVDCGGRPKPHLLENFEYIRKNWIEI